MGCWNETCMLSHLPITINDEIKVIILMKRHNEPCAENIYFDDGYTPITFPFDALYDEYGGITNPSMPNYVAKQLQSLSLVTPDDKIYSFTSIDQFIDDINDNGLYMIPNKNAIKEYEKHKLEVVYIHKRLYDIIVDHMSKRKTYSFPKTLYEFYFEQYNAIKDKWLDILTGKTDKKDAKYQKLSIATTFDNSHYNSFVTPLIHYDIVKPDDVNDFLINICRYKLFTIALNEGRIGYITRCGTGSQSCSIFTQKIIADFIISEVDRKTDNGYNVYESEDKILIL